MSQRQREAFCDGFGPLIISIDTKGNNLISDNKVNFYVKKKPGENGVFRLHPASSTI